MSDEKNKCPTCGRIIDKREIALFDGMVQALWRVFRWNIERGRHEFSRKEIEHLLVDGNQKARFGDWVLFGGLVYKYGKGKYGINLERCDEFFKNKLSISARIWKDPINKELTKVDYKFAREIPGLAKFLDEDGFYKARYATREQLTLKGIEMEKGDES